MINIYLKLFWNKLTYDYNMLFIFFSIKKSFFLKLFLRNNQQKLELHYYLFLITYTKYYLFITNSK
jgi:hypothetical protein